MNSYDFSTEMFCLKGKRAIVTGGNSGLGQTFSYALAQAGADIFVPSITDHTDQLYRELAELELE